MRLETIAFHNLRRRKARSFFLLAGLLIGVATVVSLLSLTDALGRRAQHELENFGANIIITPKSDHLALNYGGIQLSSVNLMAKEIDQKQLGAIDTIPNRRNVAAIAPKVLGSVEVSGQQALLMGVDPAVEFKLKRWWTIDGRALQAPGELVLGHAVASRLGLTLGQEMTLSGHPFTVVGLLDQTGSQDDQLMLTDLATAQRLLGKPQTISLVEVAALCHDCPVEDMVSQLRQALPGTEVQAVQQVVKTRMHALAQFELFAWGVAVTVVIIGALLVFVTMMGSVRERTREIGIFRAIGYRRSHILHLFLLEAGVVSALAGVLGYLTGSLATVLTLPLFEGGHASWQWNPAIAVSAVLAATLVGLLATLQPALRASNLDPNEALRAL